MPERPFNPTPQIPPGKPILRSYPTPNFADKIFVVKVDSRKADYKLPEKGSVFEGLDPDEKIATHLFCASVPKPDDPGFVDHYFVDRRVSQDEYNQAEVTYPWVSADYPRVTRQYVYVRTEEVPPTDADVDPVNPALSLVDYKRTRIDDPVLDKLFIGVTKVFERLPAPVEFVTAREQAVLPYDLRTLVPETTVQEFQDGPAAVANAVVTINEEDWRVSSQMITAFKRVVNRVKRVIPGGIAVLTRSRKLTRNQQVGVVTKTWKIGNQTITPSATLIEASIEDVGNNTTIKEEVVVDRVFPDSEYEVSIPDLVPPEFRALVPTTVEGQTSAGLAIPPSIGPGELSETQKQITELQKRIQITKRDPAALPVTLLDGELSSAFGFGEVMEVERTLAATPLVVNEGIGVTDSKVKNLGNSLRLRETTAVKGSQPTLKLVAGGSGYTVAPAVSFTGGSSGGGATAVSHIQEPVAGGDDTETDVDLFLDNPGDDEGVFFYLGKLGGNGTWRNPHTAGDVVISIPAQTLDFGTLDEIVDRQPSNILVTPSPGAPEIHFDLGADRSLVCNNITFRARSEYGSDSNGGVNTFSLGGSNDNVVWTPLATMDTIPVTINTWKNWVVPGATGYRYFRIIRGDVNSKFLIGELELYGTLTVPGAQIAGSAGTVTSITVTNGGNYRTPPSVVIAGGGGSGAKGAVIMSGAVVESIEVTNPGSGYVSEPDITFVGGTTTLVAAAATAYLGKSVASISVTSGGSGYRWAPAVSIIGSGGGAAARAVLGFGLGAVEMLTSGAGFTSNPAVVITGAGSGAAATAVRGYSVANIAVTAAGSGYTTPPVVQLSGSGGAAATARLAYGVVSVALTNGGDGFTSAPLVVFSEDNGTGAEATAVVGFPLDSVELDAGGSGYTTPPDVEFTGGEGDGATATAFLGFEIDSITLDNPGSGYTSAPDVSIDGDGSGAAAEADMEGGVTSVAMTDGGSGYTSAPAVVFDAGDATAHATLTEQLFSYGSDGDTNGILHFTGTGYGAGAWANPDTAGDVQVLRSTNLVGTAGETVDRTDGYISTENNAGEWVSIDFGASDAAHTVIVSDYTFQNRTGGGSQAIRNWKLQGSNDVAGATEADIAAATWTDLDVRVEDTTLTTAASAWGRWVLGATPAAYRWLRILNTNVNAAGQNYIQIAEFEFYGVLAGLADTGEVRSVIVDDPGTTYTTAPAVSFTGGAGADAAATASIAVAIVGITVTDPGEGYTSATVDFSGGGGVDVAATAVLETAGAVKSVTLDSVGALYTSAPVIGFTGGGGTGAAATAILGATDGVIVGVDVTDQGVYTAAPLVTFSGGGGANATATAALAATGHVKDIAVTLAGARYLVAPTVSLVGGGGTGATGTVTLGTVATIVSITVTAAGTGYTIAPTISLSGGGGSGATARGILSTTGYVKSVVVTQAGSRYRSVPAVAFIGGLGTGAAGTAVLSASGPVIELLLTTDGVYAVAPTVVFTPSGAGSGASAVYVVGNESPWPTLYETETDPTHGIVVQMIKDIVPAGTLHPGDGSYTDIKPIDKWRSIQIASKIDISTLPPSEQFGAEWPLSLPDTLLGIEVVWSDSQSSGGSRSNGMVTIHADSSTDASIHITTRSGFRGNTLAEVTRRYYFGPPALADLEGATVLQPVSGTAAVFAIQTEKSLGVHLTQIGNGSGSSGSKFQQVAHVDIKNVLSGGYRLVGNLVELPDNGDPVIISTADPNSHTAPPIALGQSTFFAVIADILYPRPAFLKVRLPLSSPSTITPGEVLTFIKSVERWRLGVWVTEIVKVIVPEVSVLNY